jgi:Na+-driven multidrug efflux pump
MMHIALPIVLSNLLAVAMQMTDLAFVGRIGKTELGAAALLATPSSTCCTTPCSA